MTPFGAKVREIRKIKKVTLKKMAEDLGVTPAYFSALEHGHRGPPAPGLVQQIVGYFNLDWDDVEALKDLARLSHPKVTVDTSGLSPKATELANVLAAEIRELDEDTLQWVLDEIKGRTSDAEGPIY